MGRDEYKKAAKYLQARMKITPQVGIVCGSGLSGLSNSMTDTQVFEYEDIPGFPAAHVKGHVGQLVFGLLAGVPTVCMRGRFHFYEGHPMDKVVVGVRTMRCLGVKYVVVTNAAGGLNPAFNIGDVMCITDHFAPVLLTGQHPLMGLNDDALGPRFLPVSNAYSPEGQACVMEAAKRLNFDFVRPQGCYALVSGPTYEAPTEAKWLKSIGCDTVGMSTIPEIVTAHHCGIKAIGLSLVTNKVKLPGDSDGGHANHAEVIEVANQRADQMQALVKEIVVGLKSELEKLPELPKIDCGNSKSKVTKKATKKVVKKATKAMKASKTVKKAPKRHKK
jgi:purine-nucleoside phosphorylase|mmetsp:Transcript_84755/g.133886  ORF Transcript_84755/g.133886 Transcript_84755/m.133886 type:complete len:333 (+) Transcript_84755:61-1059(+)